MPQETNEAAMTPDDRLHVSTETVLEQFRAMYAEASYQLALSKAGVEQLVAEGRVKESRLQSAHASERELTDEVENLKAKLAELNRITQEQGQIIERYRLVHGNPPEFAPAEEVTEETVQDEVFEGKAEWRAPTRNKR